MTDQPSNYDEALSLLVRAEQCEDPDDRYFTTLAASVRSNLAVVDMQRRAFGVLQDLVQANQRIAATVDRHSVGAFCGTDTACSCDRTWRKNADYRAHLAAAIQAELQLTERPEFGIRWDDGTFSCGWSTREGATKQAQEYDRLVAENPTERPLPGWHIETRTFVSMTPLTPWRADD